MEDSKVSSNRLERKSPDEIIRILIQSLSNSEKKTTDQMAKAIESSWATTWNYLNLIMYVQSCPKVIKDKIGKSDAWSREWGRLP